jgi:hybrid cluster-associated redox disulfide protein
MTKADNKKKVKNKTAKPKKRAFRISGDMIIGDVIRAFPQTMVVFMEMGIHCVGCYVANFESIEEGVSRHGIDPALVVKKLNDAINPKNVRRNTPAPKSRKPKRNTDVLGPRGTGR